MGKRETRCGNTASTKGTWGPAEADRLTAEVGGWVCPQGEP